MAHTEAEARDAQDERFASRLKQRDKSVLAEIDATYTPALYKLLHQYEGPMLRREDMSEIAQDVLMKVWTNFAESGGNKKLRNFFFDQAKYFAVDRIRKHNRRQENPGKTPDPADTANPLAILEREEVIRAEETVLHAVNELLVELTERQRIAFNRRFLDGNTSAWASQLEKETGKSASSWRKASDDALQVIRKRLAESELLKMEGGRYEVA